MEVQLDMYQTLAASVLVLMLGSYLKQQIHVLEKFCIPAPVVGGLLFAIATCICYSSGFMEISFDDTLREVCMVFFFTSVGFQANLKVLKSGGKSLAIFLGLVILLIVLGELLSNGKVEVKGGLQAGDKVAVSKLRFLSDGMPVDIISQKEKRAVTAQK